MKSLLRVLEEMAAIWLVLVLAGTSCAVFYTKSDENDYPRIGRRAFFTGGINGANYPRIGRSSPPHMDPAPLAASFEDSFHSPTKRGIFTATGGGYPRIGRSGNSQTVRPRRLRSGELSADVMTSLEGPDVLGSEEEEEATRFAYPLGLLFFGFDKNGDKTLTREEFVQGMARARQDGTLLQ